jgi:hypothetical protein
MSKRGLPLPTRIRLSRFLHDAVADAEARGASGLSIRSRYGLLGIADWLEHADTVSALGLQRLEALTTEVSDVLSGRHSDDLLGELIWWVADAMRVCPPHEWACPVIAKLDPEHTSWTCRRCGQVGISPDLDHRPD